MRNSLYLRLPIYRYGKGYDIANDDYIKDWWRLDLRLYANSPFIRYGWVPLGSRWRVLIGS